MALSFQDKIKPVPTSSLSFADKIKKTTQVEEKKQPFIPQLPEEGFLAPTPIGTTIKTFKQSLISPGELASYGFAKIFGVRPTDVGREALNILGSGEIILGKALGGGAIPFTKDFKDLEESRKKNQEMNDKLMTTIKTNQEQGKDTKRLKNLLVANLNDSGASDEEINDALKLTSKQIIGGGIQTALDVATAGTYKGLAETGKLYTPAEKIITKQTIPTILGQFKVGLKSAGIGGTVGYGFDVSNELQQDEINLTPGFASILGAGIPMLAKTGKVFSKEAKLVRREGKLNEIIESYRQAVNPLKADIKKIEIKGGRDLDNTLQFMAEEEVLPKKDPAGRLDTKFESEKLKDKKNDVDILLAESLNNKQQINNLEVIREQAKLEIAKTENNAEILAKKEEDIDNLVNAEIERYGRTALTDRELHNVKNGMWSVGFDMNRTTKSPSAKRLGNIMKRIIEENNSDNFNIRQMNNLSGQYREAIDLLDNVHGNVVQGGKLGGYFYRMFVGIGLEKVLGSIPGLKGVSFFIGQWIGKHYNEFINDPERIINAALKEAKKIKLDTRSSKILNIFEQGLKNKNYEDWQKIMQEVPPKQLPAPSFIPVGAKTPNASVSLTQEEIAELNKVGGLYEYNQRNIKSQKAAGIYKEPSFKKGATPNSPLAQEATKLRPQDFSSAEEFVKSKTPKEIKFAKDFEFSSPGASKYYDGNPTQKIIQAKPSGDLVMPKGSVIHRGEYSGSGVEGNWYSPDRGFAESYAMSGEGTIKSVDVSGKKFANASKYMEDPGAITELSQKEIQDLTNKAIKDGYDGLYSNETQSFFLPSKSQLTDIWNKANKKK